MNNDQMLELLDYGVKHLPRLIKSPENWSSLIINRRKPWTYRAFTNIPYPIDMPNEGQLRLCLHRFAVCDEHEAFLHPHPWPGAFIIVKGSYLMNLGRSPDRMSGPEEVAKILMTAGSRYAITSPMTWHAVIPLEECYTIMVNAEPWSPEVAHTAVKTTKGKDLDSMSDEDLTQHFEVFTKALNSDWNVS